MVENVGHEKSSQGRSTDRKCLRITDGVDAGNEEDLGCDHFGEYFVEKSAACSDFKYSTVNCRKLVHEQLIPLFVD